MLVIPETRRGQRFLAAELTNDVHGKQVRIREAATKIFFESDPSSLKADDYLSAPIASFRSPARNSTGLSTLPS